MSNFLMWLVQLLREYLIPFTIVHEGTRGVRWWLGKVNLRDLKPGFYWYVPYLHRIEVTASCYQEVDTLVQYLTFKCGTTVSLSANVGYEVWNAALWWTRVYNFDTTVERKIRKILFRCTRVMTYEEFVESVDAITAVTHDEIQKDVHRWGVRVVEVGFTDFAQTVVLRVLNEVGSTIIAPAAS
jgi:regulator of protease activity HflC (stomatin/prohibitin superfamily)